MVSFGRWILLDGSFTGYGQIGFFRTLDFGRFDLDLGLRTLDIGSFHRLDGNRFGLGQFIRTLDLDKWILKEKRKLIDTGF